MLGKNINSLISPILKIQTLRPKIDPNQYGAFIFSSRNGVMAANQLFNLQGRKAFVVGNKTAKIASNLGMRTYSADGNSGDLLNLIIQKHPVEKLLFLRGEYATGSVAETLNSIGLETESVVVYRQHAQKLSPEAQGALCGFDPVLIPLFSPRSAALMGSEMKRIKATARFSLIGMSQSVMDAWNGPRPINLVVADEPNAAAMVEKTLDELRAWS